MAEESKYNDSKAKAHAKSESIQVACRIRPLNKLEKKKNELSCLEYNLQEKTVSIGANGPPSATGGVDYHSHTFSFDHVFAPHANNEAVYKSLCQPILDSALTGVHGAVLCYGQTGAGKTYTMFGTDSPNSCIKNVEEMKEHEQVGNNTDDAGIIPRILSSLFQKVNTARKDMYQFDIRMTVLEIYQNKVYDLISGSQKPCTLVGGAINTPGTKKKKYKSKLKRAGISVDGATEVQITHARTALQIVKNAQKNRMTHKTKMNALSSRSHCIVILSIAKSDITNQTTTLGQLYLVDLAGSEKVSKTGAMGMRLDEAKQINTSLLTLGIVIDKLINKSRHIPYRDSNLTRLLQNCLGGNARCALCVNISPSSWNYGESISTLYFGCRTRNIKNKPKSNKFLSAAQLQENLKKYNEQILINRQILCKLENELGDITDFFEIVRNANETNLCNDHDALAKIRLLCTQRINLKHPTGLNKLKLYTSSSSSTNDYNIGCNYRRDSEEKDYI